MTTKQFINKYQKEYDLAVREVLADLSVMEEGEGCYTLTVSKDIYDKLINAEYALLAHKEKGQ